MTTSLTRPEAVRKYFIKTPVKSSEPDYSGHQTKMGIGGGLLFLALILLFSGQGLLVLVGIVSGYFGFKCLIDGFSAYSKQKKKYESDFEQYEKDYERAEPKPSDEQMQQWLDSDIERIKAEALRRLDLDNDDYKANPLILGGPSSSKETKFADGIDKNGKKITRFSHSNILVVFLTEYHVASYQCEHNMEHGQITSDRTKEFPYKEITNLGTQVERININYDLESYDIKSEKAVQEFTLETSGSNIIQVAYQFSRGSNSEGELAPIGGEETIMAIRKKLQDYKKKYEK